MEKTNRLTKYIPLLLLLLLVALLLPACAKQEPSTARLLLLEGQPSAAVADAAASLADKYPGQIARLTLAEADIASLASTYPELVAVIVLAVADSGPTLVDLRAALGEDALLIAALPGAEQAESITSQADLVLDVNYGNAMLNLALRQAVGLKVAALVCFGADGQQAEYLQATADELELTLELAAPPADYAAAVAEYVAKYGEDCGFLTIDTTAEPTLMAACIAAHTKYPLNLSADPYVWSELSGISQPERLYAASGDYLSQTRNWLLNEKFISSHYATWRYPVDATVLAGAVTYALDWADGNAVAKDDQAQLRQSLLNAGASQIEQRGDNYWLMLVNTYVFGSNTNMDCDC